jgi:chromosome segregation ATPase
MSLPPSALRRSLVGGYSKEHVERLLAERDAMVRLAEGRLRTAEAQIVVLEEEVAVMRREMSNRDSGSQSSAQFLTEELGNILSAAEEAATKIIERARVSTDQQIQEASRLWREVQAEVSRFTAWRERVDPAIGATHSHLDEVKTQVQEIPERIRQALAPLAEAIAAFDTDLTELGAASTPPVLATPTGLDEAASGSSSRPEEGEAMAEESQEPVIILDEAPADADAEEPVAGVDVSTGQAEAVTPEEEPGLWRRKKRTHRASATEQPEASARPLPASNYLPPSLGNA